MSVVIHTGTIPQELRCTRCGAAEPLRWPMGVDALLALSRTFQAAHRTCRPLNAPDCWGRYPKGAAMQQIHPCGGCTEVPKCARVTKGLE